MRQLLPWLFCLSAIVRAETVPTLAIGSAAPDFKLKGVDDKEYTLQDFAAAKILVINFTSNHCPEAQAYEDRMIKLTADYKDKGVQVVAINPNNPRGLRLDELGYTDLGDSFEEMKVRAAFKKFNFPYLNDGDTQVTARAFGPRVTPHVFVFDAARKLQYCGRIDDNDREEFVKVHDLRNALDQLLAGKEVEVKTTKTAGCSTKWITKETDVKAQMEKISNEPVDVKPIGAEGLAALRKNDSGKLRLVNFWSTSCVPCMEEFPDLITINRMYRHRAFELITVADNKPDQKDAVLNFLKRQQASMTNYIFDDVDAYKLKAAFDKDWDAADPYTMLIGAKGEVLYKSSEQFDVLELRRAIVRALKELNHGAVMDEKKK